MKNSTPEQKDKHASYMREWWARNREQCREKERIRTARRLADPVEKAKILARVKAWKKSNPEKVQAGERAYYERTKEKRSAYARDRYNRNRAHILAVTMAYNKRRKASDPVFRVVQNFRSRICALITGRRQWRGVASLIGCSGLELRAHLESQFQPGMTWENYGLHGWHVDHIRPCNTFDLSIKEEAAKCFHFRNLRPLWATENLSRPRDGRDIAA